MQQQAVFKLMQCLLINRQEALMTLGQVTGSSRVIAINPIYNLFAAFESA